MADLSSTSAASSGALEQQIRRLRALTVGSALVAAGALVVAVMSLVRTPAMVAPPPSPAAAAVPSKLDELTVGRLNVVEPDGTLRMIISSRGRFPGSFSHGKEIARPDRSDVAGILFVDDEGTENGGLVQNGQLDKSGKVSAGLSLTFDRFRQDQMLQLVLDENGDNARAALIVNDRPSYKTFSVDDLFQLTDQVTRLPPAERDAMFQRHQALGHFGNPRGYFGTKAGSAQLMLNDPQGRPRLRLSVSDRG
ncbi:MAG: hypothetical protein ABIY55_26090, partial [Kofleriaceae bacterium]